jgi:ZIP family zinc transporter
MGHQIGIALLLTAAAGLSTTLGSLLGLAVKKPGPGFMGFTLGFSAGVMVLVSFVELLQGSMESIGFLTALAAFFVGMAGIFLIDLLVPHEYIGQHDYPKDRSPERLKRTGLLLAFGIGIHNFPEGMATFAGSLQDVRVGTAIAVAIAIHNIPEGLAVSAPVYAATGSRRKAFLWSFLSGASEPVGAAVAALILLPFLTPSVLGWVLAGVAGIMVAIAMDELVPAAKAFGGEHTPILGVIVGMAVMAGSLWLLR